jgi:hypothetical protein
MRQPSRSQSSNLERIALDQLIFYGAWIGIQVPYWFSLNRHPALLDKES